MSRKDYRLIARAIAVLPHCEQKLRLIEELCVVLKRDNPSFNSRLFKSAVYEDLDKNWIR